MHHTHANAIDLKFPHGLIQAAQVAVVFCRLHVKLPKRFLGKLQRGEVQVVSLLQKTLLCLLVVAVDGDLLQDQGWTTGQQAQSHGMSSLKRVKYHTHADLQKKLTFLY